MVPPVHGRALHTVIAQRLYVEWWRATLPFKVGETFLVSPRHNIISSFFINGIKWFKGLERNFLKGGLWKMTEWISFSLCDQWILVLFPPFQVRDTGQLHFYVFYPRHLHSSGCHCTPCSTIFMRISITVFPPRVWVRGPWPLNKSYISIFPLGLIIGRGKSSW